MIKLGQQGQPTMCSQGLSRPIQLESEYRLSSHASYLVGYRVGMAAHPL